MSDIQTAIKPAESDPLLQTVREPRTIESFNFNDSELLKKMVECIGIAGAAGDSLRFLKADLV
jgi:hypothetical protein